MPEPLASFRAGPAISLKNLHCATLSATERRLLDHFYRQHGSRMRAAGDAELWVARAPGIVAGLSLSAVGEGVWLTGLFVDPQQRGQGVAGQLIEAALEQAKGPTWLFCHPDLVPFYERLVSTWPGNSPKPWPADCSATSAVNAW